MPRISDPKFGPDAWPRNLYSLELSIVDALLGQYLIADCPSVAHGAG